MPRTREFPAVENRLAEARAERGVSAADLAAAVGIRRQTIYAIEAGSYLPNTELALRLADVLQVPVGDIFALKPRKGTTRPQTSPAFVGDAQMPPGSSVHLCRIGERWVGIPASAAPYHLPVGDAIVARRTARSGIASVRLVGKPAMAEQRLVIAGCDPAALILARLVEQVSGVRIVAAAAASRAAIRMLCEQGAHLAGSHLEDDHTGEFNLAFVRDHAALDGAAVFTMARWEAGLVVAPGNPLRLRGIEDLARPSVTFVNREPGSGSRALLGKLMGEAGVVPRAIRGYDRLAGGHLAAAYRVASGDADACLATRAAAQSFGLGFVPLQSERYDFVVPRAHRDLPAVAAFLDAIQSASVRRTFAALTSYDTGDMGRQVA